MCVFVCVIDDVRILDRIKLQAHLPPSPADGSFRFVSSFLCVSIMFVLLVRFIIETRGVLLFGVSLLLRPKQNLCSGCE
jgi:hypothetical protein